MINVSYAFLNELPPISHLRVKVLNASHNRIRNLWHEDLPRDIEEVDLNTNDIRNDGLLSIWPDTIKVLNLSCNPIFSLDQVDSWPSRLVSLNLSNTNLTGLFQGGFLPETLESLNISNTGVTRIHRFPKGLKEFIAIKTSLKILPEVCNNSIEKIVVSESTLMNWGIPIYWGKSLKHLDLNYNAIRDIPDRLPETLEYLNLSGNVIQQFPENCNLPKSLKMFHINSNRILKIPAWFLELKNVQFTIRNNCLIQPVLATNCLTDSCQWIGDTYIASASSIQKPWRIRQIKRLIRTINRTSFLREELLARAMHPSRATRFHDISKEWLQ
jgi:Leucine-rich repeat (LRR) protein